MWFFELICAVTVASAGNTSSVLMCDVTAASAAGTVRAPCDVTVAAAGPTSSVLICDVTAASAGTTRSVRAPWPLVTLRSQFHARRRTATGERRAWSYCTCNPCPGRLGWRYGGGRGGWSPRLWRRCATRRLPNNGLFPVETRFQCPSHFHAANDLFCPFQTLCKGLEGEGEVVMRVGYLGCDQQQQSFLITVCRRCFVRCWL